MSEESDYEEGVCVACKATAEIIFDPGGINAPCCHECKGDGSFTEWLAAELERWMEESPDMVQAGVTADGRKLWKSRE